MFQQRDFQSWSTSMATEETMYNQNQYPREGKGLITGVFEALYEYRKATKFAQLNITTA